MPLWVYNKIKIKKGEEPRKTGGQKHDKNKIDEG